MMSELVKQTTMHIPLTISRIKGNQRVKFGWLIEYNVTNIFFNNHTENKAGRLTLDLFLFFKKALHEVKTSILLNLSFNISIALNLEIQ